MPRSRLRLLTWQAAAVAWWDLPDVGRRDLADLGRPLRRVVHDRGLEPLEPDRVGVQEGLVDPAVHDQLA
jgi:hypothetical protein